MLRLLIRWIVVCLIGSASVVAQGQTRTPNASEIDRAAQAAQRALRDTESLQVQSDFRQQLQRQRDALRQATPTTNPRIDLGRQSPTPADWLDAVRDPPSAMWSPTQPRPLLVFVSFAMPETELRELARQAARIGAPLILRGLVDDALLATQRKLSRYADITGASFAIDPTLFRRFEVSAVPTFILPLEALQACSDSICPVPAHVKLSGDAGLDHVLDQIGRRAKNVQARQLASTLRKQLVAAP